MQIIEIHGEKVDRRHRKIVYFEEKIIINFSIFNRSHEEKNIKFCFGSKKFRSYGQKLSEMNIIGVDTEFDWRTTLSQTAIVQLSTKNHLFN